MMKRLTEAFTFGGLVCLLLLGFFQTDKVFRLEEEIKKLKKDQETSVFVSNEMAAMVGLHESIISRYRDAHHELAMHFLDLKKRLDKHEGKPEIGTAGNPEPIFKKPE